MVRFFGAVLAATLFTVSQPAIANCGLTPPPAPAADASAAQQAANELAALYYPEAMISAVVERQARTAFEQGVRQSPNGEQIIAALPGLIDAGYEATMTVIRPCVAVAVPLMQSRAADILARRLSMAHMREVTAFYRSDAGRATMDAIAESMRPVAPRRRADGSIDDITRADLQSAIPMDFMRRLTPAQIAGLERFAMSPHGRAFMAVAPELEQMTVATVNAMNAGAQAEVEAAVRAAVEAYIRDNPPPRRGS